MQYYDYIIVGGGPTGLALAQVLSLAQSQSQSQSLSLDQSL